MDRSERSSVAVASIWMVVVTLVLFFLPLVNGFLGGLVGGYRAGQVKRALLAAILPAVVAAIGLWIIVAALGAPMWGFLAGTTIALIIALADVGIFAGAAVGGWMAQTRGSAHRHA